MANIADVDITINSKDKKALSEFNEILRKLEAENKLDLYNLVIALGGNPDNMYCRGTILYFDFDGETLTISEECAWGRQEDVDRFIYKKYPQFQYLWNVEEWGCDIYQTNNPDGPKFFLHTANDTTYHKTAEELLNAVNSEYHTSFKQLDELSTLDDDENEFWWDEFTFIEDEQSYKQI